MGTPLNQCRKYFYQNRMNLMASNIKQLNEQTLRRILAELEKKAQVATHLTLSEVLDDLKQSLLAVNVTADATSKSKQDKE